MAATRPIPAEALPIAERLRERARRPAELPVRFDGRLRWWVGGEPCCPIGFDPVAESKDPFRWRDAQFFLECIFPFPGDCCDAPWDCDHPDELQVWYDTVKPAFYAFINWWDEQRDARAAVEVVWGRED